MTANAVYDLTQNLVPDSCLRSGTLSYEFSGAGSANAPEWITGSLSILTGSWFGAACTWGISIALADNITSSYSGSFAEGSWFFTPSSWGVYMLVSESRDRTDLMGNDNIEIDQGIGPGDWNPFPIPAVLPTAPLPVRDTTRYRKSYSSQRYQVQRIRLVKS